MSFLHTLQHIIADRKQSPSANSYTAHLFAMGDDEIVKKVGEEAMEVLLAVKGQGADRIVAESADLIYHLLVLLNAKGLTLEQVEAELESRHKKQGVMVGARIPMPPPDSD